MSAPIQPVVRLRVWVEQDDAVFSVSKTAPSLPSGISWQKGMRFFDSGVEDGDWMEVDYIGVYPDGRVEVGFHEKFLAPISDEAISDFTKSGWTLDSST